MSGPVHRFGVVALVGAPNAGKSSLLNALVGEKLAIVSVRPQTTRGRLVGIRTLPHAQIVFLDTPGIHEGTDAALHQVMHDAVRGAAADCDLALWVLDPTREVGEVEARARRALADRRLPVIGVATKADLPASRGTAPPALEPPPELWLRVSARTGEGIDTLLETLCARLPEGPARFPEDEYTDQPVRFLAAELVREAAFEALHAELPYAVAIEILTFDESDPAIVRIDANLIVERDSQKRIAVGSGGEVVKRIGTKARLGIERLLGTRVHLALHVKVEPGWTRRRSRVEALGYR